MSIVRGPRRRATRYFVRRPDDGEPEIARVTRRGSSAVFDATTRSWVNDPLLATAIRISAEWRPALPADLPDGLDAAPPAPADDGRRSRRTRGGRHSTHAGPG
jgi:hypothetical protein